MVATLSIGVLAKRVGVSTHTLRLWERDHHLFEPDRSATGHRLYGAQDVSRAEEMVRLRSAGVPVARAAVESLSTAAERARPVGLAQLGADLRDAFRRYDEPAVLGLIDGAMVGHRLGAVIDDLVFPVLRMVGDAWECGEISVAQEHWVSGLLRARMMAKGPELLARRVGPARGIAVLACPSNERHDIGLLAFDLLLRERGWNCTFLGADTPLDAAVDMCGDLGADVLVLAGSNPATFDAELDVATDDLLRLPVGTTLALAGCASSPELATRHDALLLPLDMRGAAEIVEGKVPASVPQAAAR